MLIDPGKFSTRRVRGQALAEALLVLAVVMLAVLAVVMLGRYQGIRQALDGAARFIGFECSSRADRCAESMTPELTWQRLARSGFGNTRVVIGDAAAAGDAANWRSQRWFDPQGRPLVAGARAWQQVLRPDSLDAGLAVSTTAATTNAAGLETLRQAGPERFGLDMQSGLNRLSGSLAARLRGIGPWRNLDLPDAAFQWSVATLGDAWNAAGTLGTDLDRLEGRLQLGRDPLAFGERPAAEGYGQTLAQLERMREAGLEPTAAAFRFGELDVSILPADRRSQTP